MSDEFDPYHKWLGIPPKHQPPNHYRLLGLIEFEDDPDVIDSAANQRMAYLQDMATGPHVEESQRILNEISNARLCLLTADEKAQYDAELRAKSTPVPAVPVAEPVAENLPERVAEPEPNGFPQLVTDPPEIPPTSSTSAAASKAAGKGKAKPAKPTEGTQADESDAPAKTGVSGTLISAISVSLITLIIALVIVFKGSGDDDKAGEKLGVLVIHWSVDEREGARVYVDGRSVIDGKVKKLPKEETVEIKVRPSVKPIEFEFIRRGYRSIFHKYKFIPGERHTITKLNWRKR